MRKIIIVLLYVILIQIHGWAQTSFTQIVHKVKPCVFKIITYDNFKKPLKQGTGFFIDSLGTALSNAHVFDNAYTAQVTINSGRIFDVRYILSQDRNIDIVKFMINRNDSIYFPYLELSKDSILEGDNIFVVGSPQGLEGTVSNGIIASIRKLDDHGEVIQITAPISHGSSGSPVIKMNGKVFGIASMIYERGQNLNFAINVNKVDSIAIDTVFLLEKRKKQLNISRIVYLNNGKIITKNYFLSECQQLQETKDFRFGSVDDFCLCYYEKLLKKYSDNEISNIIGDESITQFIVNSLYADNMNSEYTKECTDELSWTKELEKYFITTCVKNMNTTSKSKMINTKEYCPCILEQLKLKLNFTQLNIYLNYLQYNGSEEQLKDLYKQVPSLKKSIESCLSEYQK